ncbi:methyltransferase domain-containing protein [Prosthecochloris sp. N3]|uniref:Methyltransferase domain-containing protein n=1 Tax=Prosthecochloris ethylica TaxID=2743976 RepID=A0ABR9XQ34_9CHLB|nr:class I SAM-dependent methyltransferase [Prosthecochloris ethylica]MBF0586538.1 methyltransferase domain-containing protein [Prosthecochloris ethylica]MBF0636151.1 methyltransferase domain-containing protein [Prosthecochloris ethylica]NUK47712.1 methyltransferase domain-containing protein [Prosthecochloris ethylica]
MLQLDTAGSRALCNLRTRLDLPPRWNTYDELEQRTDELTAMFLDERFDVSKELGPTYFMAELVDRSLRTDEMEIMDSEKVPAAEKLDMMRSLDRLNSMMMLYPHYIGIIRPYIEQTALANKRPARILELAAGTGGLSLALAEEVQRHGLPAEITASDIVASYMEDGRRRAQELSLPVSFRQIDAFDLGTAPPQQYDIILVSQSLHHFSPGRIAVMIARSKAHGASLFLGMDGHRGPELLAGVPLMAILQGKKNFMLDGYTSARKFYSESELKLIAETAIQSRNFSLNFIWPLSVLAIPLDGE